MPPKSKIRVGITMGDPSGIGPAITAKAINKLRSLADFVVIGDRWVFDKIKNQKSTLRLRSGSMVSEVEPSKIKNFDFIDLNNVAHQNFQFGKVKAEYGRASIEYLNQAIELIKRGEIECLVTCPISKAAINLSGFRWPGHTEYLAKSFKCRDFAMMLLNKRLRFVLVSRHIPLKDTSRKLNKDRLDKTIFLTAKSLKQLFLINNPRIVVCGLNPHASDNGLIGDEENQIIKPVLKILKRRIKYLDGPISSDVAISRANAGQYDCVVAMYHDQALIPLKLSGKESGVNITLGLPFIRTSPLHGTAFDIAGDSKLAQPTSLIEAIRLAIMLYKQNKSCMFHR